MILKVTQGHWNCRKFKNPSWRRHHLEKSINHHISAMALQIGTSCGMMVHIDPLERPD